MPFSRDTDKWPDSKQWMINFRVTDLEALLWNPSQVKEGLDPTKYTVRTVAALVSKMTAWEDYCDGERHLAGAMKRLGKV